MLNPGVHAKLLILTAISLLLNTVHAEVKKTGTPFIRNYKRSEYKAGQQTWSIEQGNNGLMYFANNDGLLEFDGINWKIFPLPDNGFIRAIKNGENNILYAGGYNELGYYELGESGGAVYHSLTSLLPEKYKDFDDIWKIYVHPEGVIFQSYTQLMIYKDQQIKVIPAPSFFHFSFYINGEYYVNDRQNGLYRYAFGNLFPLSGAEALKGKEIWAILPYYKKLLICTASEGIFEYDGNALKEWKVAISELLKRDQVYCALPLDNTYLIFGTIQNGLIISDNNGNLIQSINRSKGIQNNTILSLQTDHESNLWLGTDFGIDYIKINSPLSIYSYNYGISSGYTATIYNGFLYFGTNQGLFLRKWPHDAFDNNAFRIIEETRGQVWCLEKIGEKIFCGHNNGTFLIEKNKLEKVCDIPGGWTYIQSPDDPSYVIGGTYTGLILFQYKNGQWKFKGKIKGFSESSRTLAFDKKGDLWMAHGLKGLYKLKLSKAKDSVEKVSFYNSSNSAIPNVGVSMANLGNEIIFHGSKGFFRYDDLTQQFYHSNPFEKYLSQNQISKIHKDRNGNIWYFTTKNVGVLRLQEDGSYNNIVLPFKELEGNFVSGFEFVFPYDEKNIFFGTANGFVHYDASLKKNYQYPFTVFLKAFHTFNPDSFYVFNKTVSKNPISLKYRNNRIEFLFAANDFENPGQILLSTQLEGYEQNWTEWQSKYSREFTNLKEGKYVFKVRAKNIYDTVSVATEVPFEIQPPFIRSKVAYIIYLLSSIGLIFLIVLLIKQRVEKSKRKSRLEQEEQFRKREEKLQRDAIESEKEIIRMRNEKLREQMIMKDKELANATMQSLQKNKILRSLRDELQKVVQSKQEENLKYQISSLVKKINKDIDTEKQWEVFETHFENVHEAFLNRLKSAYPELSPRELKLCAYLRMNISSKEISELMNISTRGVEISRYRLRKKFNLDRQHNLTDFILSF